MEKLMKKQTLKKRTKKIEKREGIANNKICENVIRNNNYGITLIALVMYPSSGADLCFRIISSSTSS